MPNLDPVYTASPLATPSLAHEPEEYHDAPLDLDEPAASGSGTGNVGFDGNGPIRRPTRPVATDSIGLEARNGHAHGHGHSRRSTRHTDPNAGALRRMTTSLFTPEKPVGPAPGYMASLKATITSSYVNVLLIFIPVSWALYFVKHGGNDSITDTTVFCTAFIAIIPLAGLLGFTTEELSMRLGQTLGGLVNATLGNAVELIVAILALIKCELAVVQSSLVGSILSNLLLVLGCCFLAGGVKFAEQSMKSTAGQLNSSLLLISVIAVLVPSMFHFAFGTSNGATEGEKNAERIDPKSREGVDLLAMSHAVAIILLVMYVGFMIFQMWTHAHLYDDDEDVVASVPHRPAITSAPGRLTNKAYRTAHRLRRRVKKSDVELGEKAPDAATDGTATTAGASTASVDSEEEEEIPQLNLPVTIMLMVLIAVIVGVTAEFLVSSIDGMVEANPSLSAEWVGLILLPIVGNAAEHFTAVSVSVKDKLDLSISVAVGSSIQVAMLVIPILELLAWCIGKNMTLLFDPFEACSLFFTVLIVNQTLADGKSNWMEGLILILFYVLLATSFWFYPGSNTAYLLGCWDSAE